MTERELISATQTTHLMMLRHSNTMLLMQTIKLQCISSWQQT